MNEILVTIPTILEHDKRYHLIEHLQQEPEVAAVLVVDNGRNFQLTPERQQAWSKLQVIRPVCNLNWLHSNNLGAVLALERQLEYVCFLNDDVRLSGDFFAGMLAAFQARPQAGIVVPRYNGFFGDQAKRGRRRKFVPKNHQVEARWVDGTCMLIPTAVLHHVGLLDPCFRHPGWGADVDYSYRLVQAGYQLIVTHRSMLWHHESIGGLSASKIYGSQEAWTARGFQQAREDLETKYGPNWGEVLPLPKGAYQPRPPRRAKRRKRS